MTNVGGFTNLVKVAGSDVGVGTGTYASGDLVGSKLTLSAAMRTNGGTGVLHSVVVQDLTKQDAALDIVIFDSDPSGTTFTDNAAFDVADVDLPKVLGTVAVAASDYVDFNDSSVATVKSVGLLVSGLNTSDDLYACVVSGGTPTYAADELSLVFGFLQD